MKQFVFQFGGNKTPGSSPGMPWIALGIGAVLAFILARGSSKSPREITWREFVDMYLSKGLVSETKGGNLGRVCKYVPVKVPGDSG